MSVPGDTFARRRFSRFSRLGTWYILALGIIALVAIAGQVLIQVHLHAQRSDAHIINVAGRQRMLSQRIIKNALALRDGQSPDERSKITGDLAESVRLWKSSMEGLMKGNDTLGLPGQNSDVTAQRLRQTQDHYSAISVSAAHLIAILRQDTLASSGRMKADIDNILLHDEPFLKTMDEIVYQYERETTAKINRLSTLENVFLAVFLLVITLEALFIFRPTSIRVNETIAKLISAEKNARQLSGEIGALYASLEKSYEQIAIVNQPAENPRLLAKADRGGNVTFITEAFADLSGIHQVNNSLQVSHLFPKMKHADDWMDRVVDVVSDGKTWQGEVRFQGAAQTDCWFDVMITPVYAGEDAREELLILGSDISRRKMAEQTMYRKNRAEIEKKINQQKFRSVLILEGQEEERKRIAMDIHDGIGQMLTSLKYQMESIDLHNVSKAKQKISEIDQLIKEIIREVRKVTFNLKPTVLGDYGLQAGLNVFIQEIGKLTGIDLQYRTSGKISRLPQKMENNIFRIIQEAINNAIKYSGASKITVSLKQTDSELVITVKDEGKGFDTEIAEARNANLESGRGFFNMYERTEYINGNLAIQSTSGQGTTVRLTVPVGNTVSVE